MFKNIHFDIITVDYKVETNVLLLLIFCKVNI